MSSLFATARSPCYTSFSIPNLHSGRGTLVDCTRAQRGAPNLGQTAFGLTAALQKSSAASAPLGSLRDARRCLQRRRGLLAVALRSCRASREAEREALQGTIGHRSGIQSRGLEPPCRRRWPYGRGADSFRTRAAARSQFWLSQIHERADLEPVLIGPLPSVITHARDS